jgi:photosystem II stability/assembly factor-like uncharacterized protein
MGARHHDLGLTRRQLGLAAAAMPLAGCATAPAAPALKLTGGAAWKKLDTVPYRGKQDDVFFANAQHGWYVNGAGKIYRSDDGGTRWTEQLSRPGTYFRCLGFVDSERGFAGNIGTDYFPGVTETTPLYRTADGGTTWQPVAGIEGPAVKGLCAIDVLSSRFINAGVLDQRTLIHAVGRVGGPAFLLRSLDSGNSWRSSGLAAHAAMALDVKFFDEANGLVFCGSDAAVERSNALILRTTDGGRSWAPVYRSARPFELTWKASFPSRDVGYATVQNYNPDATVNQRYVVKTRDGGKTWTELPLVADHAVREFGIAFVNDNEGWVGTTTSGFETRDGGRSWRRFDFGRAVNKIRVLPQDNGAFSAFAIGVELWKYTSSGAA